MLRFYAQLVAASTLLLIVAGAMVTSTGSGLSVPDWPTSYGYFMFSFPLSYMVGGILYEHAHRLIASTVGLLTIGLMIWLWLREPRRWLRWMGMAALGAVIAQGILGGITVLFFLPAPVSIGHAGLAELFFCLTVSIALFTSKGWQSGYGLDESAGADRRLQRLTKLTTLVVYVQILLGATMRHTGAGLAIPDFPLAFGRLIPPLWSPAIGIHFAHRVGALAVLCLIASTAGRVWVRHRPRRELARPALLLLGLVILEIGLGGLTVLTRKAVDVTTVHVATGALILVTSLVLALRAHRDRFAFERGLVERSQAA